MSYLFGSILTVPASDLWVMLVLAVAIIVVTAFFFNDYLAMSYDEEFAQIRGVPVRFLYFLMIGLLAVSIVMLIQIVGLILVIALLTIPPYIAEKFAPSMLHMMVYASVLSIVFTISGLYLSYVFNLTSGATIILVAAAGFLVSILVERLSRYLKALSTESG
jgi:zinc transport system permease protein